MKIRKSFLLFLLLLLPFVVKAEEVCDNSKVTIESIGFEDKIGNAEEINPVVVEDNSLKLDVLLHDPGDSIKYVIEIRNDTEKDYYLNKDSLNIDSDYIEYEFDYGDSNVVESGSTKSIVLSVTYRNRAPQDALNDDGSLDDIGKATISMSTVDPESEEGPINPNTGEKIVIISVVLVFSVGFMMMLKNKKHVKRYVVGVVLLSVLIPSIVFSLCEVTIGVEVDVKIDGKEAYLVDGVTFNTKMKTLAGIDPSGHNVMSMDGITITMDYNISNFKRSLEEPDDSNKQEENIVSTDDSPYPVYMWFEDGTIYWWSEDSTPSLNKDSRFIMMSMASLSDMSGLETFDASLVEDMSYSFIFNTVTSLEPLANWNVSSLKDAYGTFAVIPHLENLDALAHWDVSSLVNASVMFGENQSLSNIDGIANWDVSNVENLMGMFVYDNALANIDSLAKWNISNVKSMNSMFEYTSIENVDALSKWKTSNAQDMSYMFANNVTLTNIDGLADWDTSNVIYSPGMFANTGLTNLDALAEWNVSKVENISNMFAADKYLVNIDGLANWDVSSVINMSSLFSADDLLPNVDALADWNTSNVENMDFTFNADISLTSVEGIKNWDVRKVKSMRQLFSSDVMLEEIDLSNWETSSLEIATNLFGMWNTSNGAPRYDSILKRIYLSDKFDTSHVTKMDMMFANNGNIEDYSFLAYFDTSNVINMTEMFQANTNFDSLELIKDWDVSKVTDMSYMFTGIVRQDQDKMDLLNDWDVRNVTDFTNMFSGQNVFPNFTLVPGTWNSRGTFIPSN